MTFATLARKVVGLAPSKTGTESASVTALGAKHRRRIRRMILVNSAATAALGLAWAVYVSFSGLWIVVGLQALAVGSAAGAASLALRGRMRPASHG